MALRKKTPARKRQPQAAPVPAPVAAPTPAAPKHQAHGTTTTPSPSAEPESNEPVRNYGTGARAGVVLPRDGQLAYFRRENFQYFDVVARYGRVVPLQGDPRRNEQLLRLGYLALWDKRVDGPTRRCGKCGAEFRDDQALHGHGVKDHGERRREQILSRQELDQMLRAEAVKRGVKDVEEFITDHRERFEAKVGEEEDQAIEREVASMDQRSPIFYDRTAAALER